MALVTDQFNCERIIKAAKSLAERSGTSLTVINVGSHSSGYNPAAIEYLFRVSVENGAAMSIYYSDTPEKQLVSVINSELPSRIVSGMPREGASPLRKLWLRFESIGFYTVDMTGALAPVTFSDKIDLEVPYEDQRDSI